MWPKFDLVIAFVGSAACSPCLEAMMERHPNWDTRFFFSEWNQVLIDRLLLQQEELKRIGCIRNVLILMDDVILGGKADDQLAHMCMRGRHFNISVMMAAVSYTSISKRARRSLDFLMVFTCPMQGDRKILTWEYASNNQTANFVLNNLKKNQCCVFETSRKRQKLFVWHAVFLEPSDFKMLSLPDLAAKRRRMVAEKGLSVSRRPTGTSSPRNRIGSSEVFEGERNCEGPTSEPTETLPCSPENVGVGPSGASVSNGSKHIESEETAICDGHRVGET